MADRTITEHEKRCIREVLSLLERQPLGPYDFDALCFRIDWLVGVFLRYSQMRPGNGAFFNCSPNFTTCKTTDKGIKQRYLPRLFAKETFLWLQRKTIISNSQTTVRNVFGIQVHSSSNFRNAGS